ncbi:MAG: ABC transporter substrate-binding protein [Longimicrobiales bacterium]
MALKRGLLGSLLLLGLYACAAGPPSNVEAPAQVETRFPAIAGGAVSPNDEVAAARLLAEARTAFEAGDFGAASASARQLTEEYRSVPGSSEGLWILSQSALSLGEHREAAESAEALATALPPDHSISGPAMTLRAEALFRGGERRASTVAYLELPPDLVDDTTVARIAENVAVLDTDSLAGLLPSLEASALDRRAGPILAELALVQLLGDNADEANALARRADSVGVTGRADEIVAAIFSGDVSAFVPEAPVVGVVLPMTGSPTNQEYTSLFMEGVEVALDVARLDSVPVTLETLDNRGTMAGSERGIETLEARGAIAVLGPLLDENVVAASAARAGNVALFSPTARGLPADLEGVYSAASVDPGAARVLAQNLSELGFSEAVVVHPLTPERTEEALAFEESFLELGGLVRGRFDYDPGTTYFEESLLQVEALAPEVLVLAIPAADIELLAPQVAFFGLDTLGIQVAGTAGWGSPASINSVDRRHTDRVIAVSSAPPGVESDLIGVFIDTYETKYRKTLRSLVPAMGFDLFRLVLTAYEGGVRTPGDFIENLEQIRLFEGVTGTYSVVEGQIVREYFPVRIFEGDILPIDTELPPLPERPGN